MKGIREILNTTAGRIGSVTVVIGLIGLLAWTVKTQLGPSEAVLDSRKRMFICTETLKAFPYEMTEGEPVPVKSPFSGKNTGVLAEACYWTKEGKIKETPDYVCINQARVPPIAGPTFCPVCDRLVVPHNPRPGEGSKPPPLKSEYKGNGREFDR